MLTVISSPTTHSFYFNILKDYLPLLLVSNIATFLIIKADGFSVCQLQLFEENTHIFLCFLFFPQAQQVRGILHCSVSLHYSGALACLDLGKLEAKVDGREKLSMREGGSKL